MYFILAVVCFCAIVASFAYLKDRKDREKRTKHPRNTPQTAVPSPLVTTTSNGDNLEKGWRTKMKELREEQWVKNALVVLAALALIHIGAYLLLEDLYRPYVWNRWAFFTQVALGAGFAMRVRMKDAKPPRHILGTLVLVIALLVVGKYTVWPLLPKISTQASTTSTPGQSVYVQTSASTSSTTSPLLTAATFNMEENPCLERIGWKGPDVKRIKEALVDYPALLAIACRESGLNHMDPKNPDQVLVGKSDPRDKGFLQINSFYHPPETVEKEVGCRDTTEFTCSERYGKKVYDKYGLNPWYPYGTRNESGRTYKPLTVPVIAREEYGPRINIPRLTNETRFDHPGHQVVVEAEGPDGSKKEYTLTHGQYTGMGHVVWLRIKRGPDETGNVGLKITYIFQQSPIVN